MEKIFKATDYIRMTNGSLNPLTICSIINCWESKRMACEYELIYDLHEKDDFIAMIDLYDIQTTVKCYNMGRFYYGGFNLKYPQLTDIKAMLEFVNKEFDLDYFKELDEDEMRELDEYFDMEAIKNLIQSEYDVKRVELTEKAISTINEIIGFLFQ